MTKPKVRYIVGVFEDDEKLLHAVDVLHGRGVRIADAFTPFPVHGLDIKLQIRKSGLPRAAFWFGAAGMAFALWLQWFMLVSDWPMNIGGKPSKVVLSFIPITFELTILLASLGMVAVYLFRTGLKPGRPAELCDLRQTDDRFVLIVKGAPTDEEDDRARAALRDAGALDVRETELTERPRTTYTAPALAHH